MTTQQRAKMTTTTEGIKVGDYFYSSWGYDQTNIDFFEVVAVTAKSVRVRKVYAPCVESNGYQDAVVPGKPVKGAWVKQNGHEVYDPEAVETKMYRVNDWSGTKSFTWRSYANAYLWDGKAKHQTNSNYGH